MFLGFQKLSLFSGNFCQALGVVLEVKWIHDGAVHTGRFCTAQGFTILFDRINETENALFRIFFESRPVSSSNSNHCEDSTRSMIPPTYHTDARGVADYYNLYI